MYRSVFLIGIMALYNVGVNSNIASAQGAQFAVWAPLDKSEAVQELLWTSARTCLVKPSISDTLLQGIDEALGGARPNVF